MEIYRARQPASAYAWPSFRHSPSPKICERLSAKHLAQIHCIWPPHVPPPMPFTPNAE
ncbi:hypothetical protein CNECB9_930011 [Cupriavidus necator]|uniref:Uncharacterized protein n=1 Tax=Cupriavidus necator TaxID=106590 RepID=A0A1K0IT28_CUPNE|nr:hypothetical protein CNECB9_930011 [Cupriavidus necator]